MRQEREESKETETFWIRRKCQKRNETEKSKKQRRNQVYLYPENGAWEFGIQVSIWSWIVQNFWVCVEKYIIRIKEGKRRAFAETRLREKKKIMTRCCTPTLFVCALTAVWWQHGLDRALVFLWDCGLHLYREKSRPLFAPLGEVSSLFSFPTCSCFYI